MTRVADASALVLAHTDEGPRGQWARSIFDEGGLIGPSLVYAEASNALRRMEYRGAISQQKAESALLDIIGIHIGLHEFLPYVRRAWELRHNTSAYDAWYIAIAEENDCQLVTGDLRLRAVPGVRCEIVTPPRG